jgi:peptidoglycan/xylan/chitin deacetylase (PgdA/CDA1 family)
MGNGKLILSLDFELFWGVRDKLTLENYGEHIKGVHSVLPKILSMFEAYNVHATFATVGFLFCDTKEELNASFPDVKPGYRNLHLSPYEGHMLTVGKDVNEDPYHFAGNLLQRICSTPGQEVSTHTFSHFYCLEEGQTAGEFRHDLMAAKSIADKKGIALTSLVFPRNQFNEEYLKVCTEMGLLCFRGNEQSWLYTATDEKGETLLRRALRLLDAYVNISGHHCYTDEFMRKSKPVNIPASRFFRPFHPKLQFLEKLKLQRIKSSMLYAAKNNLTYHLWWHPHNFGINQDQNLALLKKVLEYYQQLNKAYGFKSYTMTELATLLVRN